MSNPSDRPDLFLPGLPWFCEIEAKGRLIPGERNAWGQAA